MYSFHPIEFTQSTLSYSLQQLFGDKSPFISIQSNYFQLFVCSSKSSKKVAKLFDDKKKSASCNIFILDRFCTKLPCIKRLVMASKLSHHLQFVSSKYNLRLKFDSFLEVHRPLTAADSIDEFVETDDEKKS